MWLFTVQELPQTSSLYPFFVHEQEFYPCRLAYDGRYAVSTLTRSTEVRSSQSVGLLGIIKTEWRGNAEVEKGKCHVTGLTNHMFLHTDPGTDSAHTGCVPCLGPRGGPCDWFIL